MDCLRSGLDGPVVPRGFEAVVEALPWDAAGGLPRKSKPSKESAGFVSFGGAANDRGGIGGPFAADESVVLGRTEGDIVSSLKRSTGCIVRLGGRVGWLGDGEACCEEARSNFAFCCTTFRGCSHSSLALTPRIGSPFIYTTSSSPSVSRVAGSGMAPAITHLFDSYFVRMKFSIFLGPVLASRLSSTPQMVAYASDGTCPGASWASQYLRMHKHILLLKCWLFSLVRP